MATKGQRLTNPATGEYFEFVETAAETGGKYSTVKVLLKKGGFKPVLHKHLEQDESFEVVSGKFTYQLEGKAPVTIGVGERATLPKAVGHTHYNDGDEDLIVLQTASPALDFEPFLEAMHLNIVRGLVKNGQPPFLQLMVWMNELVGKTCVAAVPVGVQRFLAAALAPVGRLRGYRAFYD